jgi:tetratricopeptide (TPR) repeat protein
MSANTIRNVLGLLQDDPERTEAFGALRDALGVNAEGTGIALPKDLAGQEDEIASLLEKARTAHATRREFEAVAGLLAIEVLLAKGSDREANLVALLAAVRDEEVLDDPGARAAYERLLELRPGDAKAEEFIETADAKRAKWADIVAKYVDEAKQTQDAAFKASMLVGAAEVAYRFGRPQLSTGKKKKQLPALITEVVAGLREALTIDPKSTRALLVLERVFRTEGRWEDLAVLLEQRAESAAAKDDRVAGLLRLARVLQRRINAPERAQDVYAKVLDLQPGNREATSALVDVFTSREMWDHLVALYEGQLATLGREGQAGTILQIAMVHWKMRNRPDAAEPYFERLRKLEPAHPGMLGFFREWCAGRGENARLTQILTDASRALPEGAERNGITSELAKLAEEGANATKAIEGWRNILRQDPGNREARDSLKRLYRQTGGWNALTDLLRSELERLPASDTLARLALLREIGAVYKDSVKSDSALVTVLAQIVAIEPTDITAVRELARVYDVLGRWRDLLTTQARLVELEADLGAKVELCRAVARRWLDQFSNVQNALEAYEKLADLAPEDPEAIAKLRELYTKRRAFKSLYDLLDRMAQRLSPGPARREVWLEMARIAAERLDRGVDAAALYRKLVDEDPAAPGALDALEKQAERDKDYKTVAEVLERRVVAAADVPTKLSILQKLGGVYTDRLHDVEGAKKAWRRVLDLQPGHPKALRVLRDSFVAQGDYDGLTELYETQNDFEGLAEVLSSAADRTTDAGLKVDLSYRAAEVYVQKLKAPERAFRAYERILASRPSDARAAAALVPLYEKEEKWARLPPLYEVLLARAEDEAEKLAVLEKLAHVTGHQLGDRAASFAYARRAYDLAAEKNPRAALATFEAAAQAAGAWGEFVEALEARLPNATKSDKRALRAKIAEVQAREGQLDEAVRAYRSLVEEDAEDESALQALDRLLRGADRQGDLRWLFDLRVTRAEKTQKIEVLTEWAALEEDVFQAPDQAVAIYRRILEVDPQHGDALRSVARLLRAAGDLEGAVDVLERDRDLREGTERAARDVEIAQLTLKLKRPEASLAAAKRALDATKDAGAGGSKEAGPGIPPPATLHQQAIAVVEELLSVGETRAPAAVVLDEAYGRTAQLARQAEVLEVRIATAAAKEDRSALYVRLAGVHERLGALGVAFDVIARAAREFPSELHLWDRLAVLAQRTKRSQQFVAAIADAVPPTGETGLSPAIELDLSERAATLYEEALGEHERARPYLERILSRDPTNERAFARLKQILTGRERWEELEQLYERVVQAFADPARKTELLSEIALIAEEITGDKARATGFYERILELQPKHEHSLRSLDALYAAQERWPELVNLLERRILQATSTEALVFRLRLGALRFARLNDPKQAIEDLDDVLQADPASREARDLVEKCLDISTLRPRAAIVLERVYAARDDVRELVRVLEIRLETVTDTIERRDLLRRIAELRDQRLSDDAGALDAFARFVPLAPGDEEARKRLLEIARRVRAEERAASVLLEAAEAAASPQPRAEILGAVAALYEDPIKDPVRAEGIYRRVLDLDPEDPVLALPAARALERIYATASRSADLAKMLSVQVKLEEGGDTRRELLARLGELSETVLSDPPAAIAAWKQRLEDDPADERALEALDRLYERTAEWRALVEILRARERAATEKGARRTFMVRAGGILAEKLADVPEAILAYRAVLDDFGADAVTLSALEQLYATADRWMDLAETLEAHLALADTDGDKLTLLARLGEVRQTQIADLPSALEAYARALALDGAHGASRAALLGLLDDPSVRREAAALLRPLYEKDEEHARLLRVLEIEAEYADVPDAKLAVLAHALRVAEGPLHDAVRAWGYAARGVREGASTSAFPTWHAHAERLTEATADYAALATLLKEVAPEIADGDVQLDVTLRIAGLARTKLADTAGARDYYVKALDLRGDEKRALEALEAIYEETRDAPALLDILKRRAEVAATDDERKVILFKQARLSDETMRDARAAIETYEQILSFGLDTTAIAALERLYADAGRWDDLIALHEREITDKATSPARKADLLSALGRIHEKQLANFDEAFLKYEEALAVDAGHGATVAALEALMEERTHSARAAEMLEAVYLARLDWRRVMTTLEARLVVSEDPDERRQLLKRLSKLHEEQGEDYRAALETTAKLLAEDLTDETTWAELERLARVANAEARLAEIFAAELDKVTSDEPATARLSRRTGELFELRKDVERALHYYRRAHAFAPEERDGSFEAIDRLLRESNRPAERVALYRQSLDWRDGAKERLTTLHTIALLEEAELGDDDKAIDTYRAALDVDETDAHSLESLSRLYARRERWRELGELLRRRAEQSALPDDEAKFRLELGRLLEHKLGDTTGAIDEYQATTELAPAPADSGKQGVLALEAILARGEHKARLVEILRPIYERADDWKRLVSLNDERLGVTEDRSEKVAVLRETAKLEEQRGGDPGKAFDAVRAAFVLDPDDGDTRGELDRLAEVTKRWDALADAYEQGIAKTEGIGQRELLASLARVHDRRRDDPRRALEAWERLFKQDETDIAPLEEMDSLATILSDWNALVRVLVKKVELLSSDEDRASAWRRVGEARRDMLDDVGGAIDAYEAARELEPGSTFTLDNLIALYEQKNDAARLVDLYRRRVDLCGEDDQGLKFQLLVDAATRYETGLEDRREAIAQLNEALTVRPFEPDVLKRLDALYTHERQWPELLENLRQQATVANDEGTRRFLKKRIGALLASQLEDPRQALESYREVLASDFDSDAVAAVRTLGEKNEDLRLEAAEVLEPVLRKAEKWADLANVFELRLQAQTEPSERAKTLRALAETTESRLGDGERAQGAILRALLEEPHDPGLHSDAERLSERLGTAGWQRYADALAERAANVFDASITNDLYTRLGRVAEEKLGDDLRAAKAYARATEQAGDTPLLLSALDRLYGRLNDARSLADVLERRIAVENDPSAQAELLHRLASLQIHEFADRSRGLATLRQSLERDPRHAASREAVFGLLSEEALFDEAFDALEWVHRQLGQSEELAKLYRRKVERALTVRDRARARLDLARVLEEDVKDVGRAQRVIEEALEEDPADIDVLVEIERLAPRSDDGWQRASSALERALGETKDVPAGTRGELWLRLATWRRDHLSDLRGAEDAFVHALSVDPENLEVLRSIETLRRVPGRERELVATLRQRAWLETDAATKRDLLRQAKELADQPIADPKLAEEVLRDLLAEDEGDRWALTELGNLREAAGDWKEVAAILLRRADLETAPEMGILQHRAAEVITGKLSDAPRAIGIYEAILEAEPSDRLASANLRELYSREGRDRDLSRLLELLVETSESSAERAMHRLDLAKLQDEKFGSARDAAETLRAILEEEPAHEGAVLALSHLLEKTSQDEELAELFTSQIEGARERGDSGAELTLRVRLAETYESRLKDTPRALTAYEAVLERDPTHRRALEAVARLSEGRGAWDRAATALAKLVELGSGLDGVADAVRLASAREQLGDTAGVEVALRRALEIQPANTKVREELRTLYEREKHWDALAALLVGDADLIAAANPDAVAPVALATSPSIPPPAPGTRTSLAPSLSLPPPPSIGPIADQVRLLRRAAEIHLKERNAAVEAVPILERATALTPTDRDLLLLLCDAYSAAGRPRDAASVLEKVIASFGNRRTKELSLYHHRLGRALASLGDKDVAIAQLDMAFKIDPGSVGVLKDLGVLALETNDLDRAQKTFRALLLQRLDPSFGISKGEVFFYLGEICAKQGDKQKAVQMLERAIENEPSLSRARAMLTELKS